MLICLAFYHPLCFAGHYLFNSSEKSASGQNSHNVCRQFFCGIGVLQNITWNHGNMRGAICEIKHFYGDPINDYCLIIWPRPKYVELFPQICGYWDTWVLGYMGPVFTPSSIQGFKTVYAPEHHHGSSSKLSFIVKTPRFWCR